MQDIAKQIIFTGRVQGVGFRFTANRIANRHMLTGFVRNLHDGTVEMLAQGRPEDIKDCISDLKIALPRHMTRIRTTDLPPDPRHTEFKITF